MADFIIERGSPPTKKAREETTTETIADERGSSFSLKLMQEILSKITSVEEKVNILYTERKDKDGK